MCGIFGIVTEREQELGPILIEAGKRLSYRGYDSVGFATMDASQTVDLRKDVGKVGDVAGGHGVAGMKGLRGMTQLRWATFGAPSQANAQPHLDSTGDMVGAHNGNVVNNAELRAQFMAEGMAVRSTNDGESCVHAVERYLREGLGTQEAVRRACADLEGDYAFVIGRKNEDCLYAVKMGSGLVAGLGDGFTCVGSDLPCLLPLTRKIVRLRDGEMVILRGGGIEVRRIADGTLVDRPAQDVEETMEAAQKGGYPHFMLKEIHEQPKVAQDLLHLLGACKHMKRFVDRLKGARNLYFVGCGTSYHACVLGSVYMARLAGKAAVPVLAPQFTAQYVPALGPGDVGVFVSQSGETKDVLGALEAARAKGATVLGLANVLGSSLMHASDVYLPLACGFEISVPATKTFTNQCVAFLALALRAAGKDLTVLDALPSLIEATLGAVDGPVKELAPTLAGRNDLYCLGYGLTYAIALEGALKIKEVTYTHCEGMLSTEFKHGPLSAVDEGFPILFVAGPEDVPLMVSGINETACRGARTVVIAQEDPRLRANARGVLVLPPSDPLLAPILGVIPLQLLSYRLSVARGHDPDFPRNLSKTLTVD